MKRLRGSAKEPAHNSRPIGDVDPEKMMSVTVLLRPKEKLNLAKQAPGGNFSRAEFAARFGAETGDVAKVEEYAATHHLSVHDVNLAARTLVLHGRTADMQKAFGVELKMFTTDDNKRFRGREGHVYVPDELQGIVQAVFGLDDRPVAKPHVRVHKHDAKGLHGVRVRDVAKLYGFPSRLDGEGECIALIQLGGGFRKHDLDEFFKDNGLKTPTVVAIGVHGATNNHGHDRLADGEVTLDVEIAGAIVPKAKLALYFAPNTNAGFLAAVNAAIHDDIRKPNIVSISWGGAETTWTDSSREQIDYAFQVAAAMGLTVLAAAGDDGASDGIDDGKPHVDFPASSPHVLACGGTHLAREGSKKIKSETVWNNGPNGHGATGGGISDYFDKPSYQHEIKVKRRGVPDVAGNADPNSGYRIVFGGKHVLAGGTSAVAPLYAGLTARLNQARRRAKLPPVGFINPILYKARNLCRSIVRKDNDYSGNLGVHKAGPGWNACAGFGSVIGQRWASLFTRGTAAGAD